MFLSNKTHITCKALLGLIFIIIIQTQFIYAQQSDSVLSNKSDIEEASKYSYANAFSNVSLSGSSISTASEELVLISHRLDNDGVIPFIEGKLKNNSTNVYDKVQINVTFYNSDNQIQSTNSRYIDESILSPGMTTAFKINGNNENKTETKAYKLEITGRIMDYNQEIDEVVRSLPNFTIITNDTNNIEHN